MFIVNSYLPPLPSPSFFPGHTSLDNSPPSPRSVQPTPPTYGCCSPLPWPYMTPSSTQSLSYTPLIVSRRPSTLSQPLAVTQQDPFDDPIHLLHPSRRLLTPLHPFAAPCRDPTRPLRRMLPSRQCSSTQSLSYTHLSTPLHPFSAPCRDSTRSLRHLCPSLTPFSSPLDNLHPFQAPCRESTRPLRWMLPSKQRSSYLLLFYSPLISSQQPSTLSLCSVWPTSPTFGCRSPLMWPYNILLTLIVPCHHVIVSLIFVPSPFLLLTCSDNFFIFYLKYYLTTIKCHVYSFSYKNMTLFIP